MKYITQGQKFQYHSQASYALCSCRPEHTCLEVNVCMHVCSAYVKISSVPRQHLSKHGNRSVLSPTQFSPLLNDKVLLHERVRTRVPVPHVTLHFPNSQDPQPPSTVNIILTLFMCIIVAKLLIRHTHAHTYVNAYTLFLHTTYMMK